METTVVPLSYSLFFGALAFVLGACIGSFLNVVIYRLPLNLSVNQPKRSFCPHCKYQIPWHHNLPLISWLWLRGKCANCGAPIAFRYFAVELLTGLLFLAVWCQCWPHAWFLAPGYWVFTGLLVAATFIDLEHFIIPDEITLGGAAAGVVLSTAVPAMQGVEVFWQGALWSVIGAAAGYFTLWGIVEMGKLAFGRKRTVLKPAAPFSWQPKGDDDAELTLGEETMVWSELFYRESDRLVITCVEATIDGERWANAKLEFYFNRVRVGDREFPLEKVDSIAGVASEVVIPREAMGFGDVKFLACIGAFLGWKAVFFSLVSACFLGAVIGGGARVFGKREGSGEIPFGPYLAAGALLWLFFGPPLAGWFLDLTRLPVDY